jgi:hypothetical protein
MEEWVYLSYIIISLVIIKRSLNKNLTGYTWQEPGGRSWCRAHREVLLTACSAFLLTKLRTTSPGMEPPRMGSHQSLIKKILCRIAYSPSYWGIFLIEVPSSLMTRVWQNFLLMNKDYKGPTSLWACRWDRPWLKKKECSLTLSTVVETDTGHWPGPSWC